MVIRIKRNAKYLDGAQVTEDSGIIACQAGEPRACYAGMEPKDEALCGSNQVTGGHLSGGKEAATSGIWDDLFKWHGALLRGLF